jgi:hypothetical protein
MYVNVNLNVDVIEVLALAVKLAVKFACFRTEKRASGRLQFRTPPLVARSSLCIFNLTLYYALLRYLHKRLKFISFICYEIYSSYTF